MGAIERIKRRHGFAPKGDGFDHIRGQVRFLQDRYRTEAEYFDFRLKANEADRTATVAIGRERNRVLSGLADEIVGYKTRLPPFTELHPDGYFVRHPVTEPIDPMSEVE